MTGPVGSACRSRTAEAALLTDMVARVDDELADCLSLARALGLRGVEVFVDGSRGALRHAASELAGADPRGIVSTGGKMIGLDGYGVALRPCDARPGLAVRQRLGPGGGMMEEPGADVDAGSPLPNLACDLLGDPEVLEAARGPVFAALLASALASQTWLHLRSGSVWSEGSGAARVVAGAVAGGRAFPDLTQADLGGLVDGAVVDALGALGWARLRAPLPPGFNPRTVDARVRRFGA